MKQRDIRSRSIAANPPYSFAQQAHGAPLIVQYLINRLEQAGVSRVRLEIADGRELVFGQPQPSIPVPRVKLRSLRAILRGWFSGLNGWAEGFIAGDWDCQPVVTMTDWAMANEQALESAFSGSAVSAALSRILHRFNANSRRGSRRNIAFHYDLGNDFYRLWLDPSMTYSAAMFADPQQPLEQAQQRKYQRIQQLLQPQPGDRVLEIGCGWGGFGESLLRQLDAHWHGVTLSQQQLDWSRERLHPFGDRAVTTLTDYRDLDQRYDRIVSIEMLEAVGEANWPIYFEQIRKLLKPGGQAVIQVITIADERFESYRKGCDFIQRYVFPGGMLPSPGAMRNQIAGAGMQLLDEQGFGMDYAQTLVCWHQAFVKAWPQIAAQGFDERFFRLWSYYLAYCESGFKAGAIDVRLYRIGTADGDYPPIDAD